MEGRFEEQILSRLDDEVCLRWRGESWTGERLRDQVVQLASSLGNQSGHRIGVRLPHEPSLVVAVLGILRAGGVCVPLEPGLPEERVRALLAEVETDKLLEHLAWPTKSEQSSQGSAGIDEPAFVFFTSGSTGRPKGVLQTHRQVCRGQLGPLHHLRLGKEDRLLMRAPISTSGLACEIGWPLLTGGRIVLASDEQKNDPSELVQLMLREEVTVLLLTPSLLSLLLDEDQFSRCNRLRYLISAGEPLGPDLHRRVEAILPGRLGMIYGTTEAPSATLRLPGSPGAMSVVGTPVATKKIRIQDGEIQVGGGIAQGYWNRTKLTEERFLVEPETGERWYRTGDLGRICEDGSLELLGRADRQIQIRGFRVEPAEVEAVLRSHPAIKDAAVGLRRDSFVAWVTAEEKGLTPKEVRRFAATLLPPQMLPDRVLVLPSFPLNPGGKLDHQALPDPPEYVHTDPSEGHLSRVLAMMKQALNSETLGPDGDFFEHGGHSVLAMQLLQQIEEEFSHRLPGSVFLHSATARSLCEALEKKKSGPQLVPFHIDGAGTPLFCVPGLSGEILEFRKFAEYLKGVRPVYGFQARGTVERDEHANLDLRQAASDYLDLLPDEPLHLLAYSAGAAYALEMATQWHERNRIVAWLGFIDAPAPGHDYKNFLKALRPSHLGTLCQDLPPRIGSFKYGEFLKSSLPNRRLRDRDNVPKDRPSRQAQLRREVVRTIKRQTHDYLPDKPFPGEATVLRASVQPLISSHSPDLGWSRWCKTVKVITFSGHHYSLLEDPTPILESLGWA
jgi:L-serine---[L-seryl-carrier protein] ligase